MVKTPELSRRELLRRARDRATAEKGRRLKLIREIAKKQQLLRSAKAEERDDS
jgi:hypothetical protein